MFPTVAGAHDPLRSMPDLPLEDTPPPIPPTRPEIDECCRGACDPCIFDLYDNAIDRYHDALRAWQERRMNGDKGDGRSAPT